MSGPSRDVTPLPDLRHARARAGPVRERRPVYVDLLPPCNAGCPAGENIQAWLAHTKAGRHEQAWRELVADNPFPAIHGRVCYHPCESVCNRANLDSAVSIHGVERFLGDLALEQGWLFDPPPGQYKAVVVNYDQVMNTPDDWFNGNVSFRSPDPRVVTGVKEAWTLTCSDARGRVQASRQVIVDRGVVAHVGNACTRK